jgi:fibronectin-binding autotransporter adhesin
MSTLNACDRGTTHLQTAIGRFASLLIVTSLIVAQPALAGNTWNGANLDNNLWSLSDNWNGVALPTFPGVLTFSGTLRPTSSDDLTTAATVIQGITFDGTGSPMTIFGNAFTLGDATTGTITNNSTSLVPQVINNNFTLGHNLQVLTTATGALTLGGNIDGNFALIKDVGTGSLTGAGLLTLSGTNSYAGGTTINIGTLNVGSAGALGTTGSINFGATAGTLQYSSANQVDYSSRLVAGQTYRVDTNSQNVTWATALTGASALTKSGTGTLTLSGNNTFSGVVTVNTGGTVVLNGNNNGRTITTAARTVVNAGGTLQLVATGANTTGVISTALSADNPGPTIVSGLTANGTLNLRSDSNVTFAGTNNLVGSPTIDVNNVAAISGSGNQNGVITLAAGGLTTTGTWTITGDNGYSLSLPSGIIATGGVTLNPTTASVSVASLAGNTAAGAAARTFTLTGTSTTGNVVTGAIANGLNSTNSTPTATAVTKQNTGSWTLAGANTFTGNVRIDDGTLALTGSYAATTATLQIGGNGANNAAAGGGTFNDGSSSNATFATTNFYAGTNTIINSGSGTLALGTVQRAIAGGQNNGWATIDFSVTGSGSITTTNTTNANGIFVALDVGGASTVNLAGGYATFNGNTWAVAPASSGGAITGLAGGSYSNTGTTALSSAAATANIDIAAAGTNASGASQTVNSLRFNDGSGSSTVDATGGLTLTSGGILVTSNVGNNPVAISGGVLKGAVRSDGATGRDLVIIQNNPSNTLTISSAIADSGTTTPATGLGKSGPGVVNLAGDNTFTGQLIVSGSGTLILSGDNVGRTGTAVGTTTVLRGAKLQLQANAHNTTSGVSRALSPEYSLGNNMTGLLQPVVLGGGSILQLRSDDDVTFAGLNNFGGLGGANVSIDVNDITSGVTGKSLTISPDGFATGNTTISVTGGNGYKLRTGPIYHVQANNLTLNPTTADIVVGTGTTVVVGSPAGTSATAPIPYSLCDANANNATFVFAGTTTGNIVESAIVNNFTQSGGVAAYGANNNSVIKNGTSTWTLKGTNVYTGSTTVNSGTLRYDTGSQLGSIVSNAPTTTYPGAITINGGLLDYGSNATTTTLTGTLSGTGGEFRHSGSGTVVLAPTAVISPFSGATTITGGGTLRVNGIQPNSPITVTSGKLSGIGTTGAITVGNSASNTVGNFTDAGNNAVALKTGNLSFQGLAKLSLYKDASTTSPSLVVGTLSTTPANGKVTIGFTNPPVWISGNTYRLISYTAYAGTVANDFMLDPANNGLGARQSGVLGSTGTGNGFITVLINGASPVWTGAKNGNWTTTAQGSPFNWSASIGVQEFLANDQVVFDDSATGTTNITINDANVGPASATFNNSTKNYSISGAFGIADGSGVTPLRKTGTGTLTLGTSNSYSGGTTLNGGLLNFNANNATGTGNLTINGGTLGNTSGNDVTLTTTGKQIVWNADIAYTSNNGLNLGTGAVSMGGDRIITVAGPGSLTVGGNMSGGTASLTKLGNGSLILNGNNTFSGTTTISAGNIQLGSLTALGQSTVNYTSASGLTFLNSANTGTFVFGGLTGTANLALVDSASSPVNLSVGSNNTTPANPYSGVLSGAGGLTKAGTGTLTLTGSNTYTGITNLNGGVVNLGSAENPGVSGPIGQVNVINFGGGTLQYSAANNFDYSSRFSTGGTNPAFRVDTNGRDVTWASNLVSTSGGSLTKSGSGTLWLQGDIFLTGPLTVNAAAAGSTSTVILSGTGFSRAPSFGFTAGLTVVNSGDILELRSTAGNSTGTICYALSDEYIPAPNPGATVQPLTLNNGSTLRLRSNTSLAFAGGNNFGGTGNSTITIDVNNNGSGSGNTLSFAPYGVATSNTTFNVTGGNGYSLTMGPVFNVAANTVTFNPTSANLTLGSGFYLINGTTAAQITAPNSFSLCSPANIAATFNLSGSTTGNVVSDKITDSVNDSGGGVGVYGTGANAVSKTGNGTWTLIGANTYSGNTTVSDGTLLIGVANGFSNNSGLVLSGGKLSTGGFNQSTTKTLTLQSSSAIDMATAAPATTDTLTFGDSSAVLWTAGANLSIAHWNGTVNTGGGTDRLMFTVTNPGTGLTPAQVSQIHFQGYNGATLLGTGEVVPTAVSTKVAGDFDQNGVRDAGDIGVALAAVTDIGTYRSTHGLTNNDDFLNVADVDVYGSLNNLDLQAEINGIANGGFFAPGGSSLTAVPEPSGILLLGIGGVILAVRRARRPRNH